MKMTDIAVRNLKPPADRVQRTYFDDTFPGFGVRVTTKGTKSWVVMTGVDRKLLTLSRYPDTSLKEARDAARRVLIAPRQAAEPPITLKMAVELFLSNSAAKNRPKTHKEYSAYLNRFLKPLYNVQLSELTTDQILKCVEALHKTPTQQVHVFNVTNTMFRFCVNRRLLKQSPLLSVSSPGNIPSRNRVLTQQELKAVWNASLTHPYTFGKIIQFCILSGQRRGEIVQLTWKDIDQENRTITIPASIAKNGLASAIPYGDMLAEVLDTIPKSASYLFPGRLKGYFWGFSRAKELFDKDCPIDHYTIHDIRRSFATFMAEIGVPQIIVEKILNHASGGSQSPIARIYNRYNYMKEMREAIAKYETFLIKLFAS